MCSSDLFPSHDKCGIVNKKGEILVQDRIKTNEHENVEEFIDDLAEKLNPMIEQYGGPEAFVGIGMGAPNANYYQGTIEYAANLKWKGIIPMAELLEQKFKIPAKLTNDANAAAHRTLYAVHEQHNRYLHTSQHVQPRKSPVHSKIPYLLAAYCCSSHHKEHLSPLMPGCLQFLVN